MGWTQECPKVAGWYWLQAKGSNEIEMARVYMQTYARGGWVEYMATEHNDDLEELEGSWWYGPLEPPPGAPVVAEGDSTEPPALPKEPEVTL